MPGASASPLPATEPTTFAMAASPANSTSSSSPIEVSSRYRDNAGAGSSPPAAQGIKSTLTNQEIVRGICKKFSIPADYKPSCPGVAGRACKAPPHLKDCICVYEAALDAGMRIPLHPFYSKLLRHYSLAPSQLTPNSWRYIAAFLVLCSDVGLKPRLSVFRHFFTVCLYTQSNRDGWHIVKPQKLSEHDRRCRLFSTSSWQLTKNDGWKERFFFLSSPTATWPCPVKWGMPTKEAAGDPKLSVKAKEDIRKLYNMQESACIDLMSLLASDKLAAALAQVKPLKKEVNFGATVAMTGPTTPRVKSPLDVPSPVTLTPPGGSISQDQVLLSAANTDRDDWVRTVLNKTADVVIKESSLLRQQLSEARESEAAAKVELLEARKSRMAFKSDLDNARKSEAAAKAELATTQAKLAAARSEIGKVRKSEEATKAQLSKANKSKAEAKIEIAIANAKLEGMRKSEVAIKAELISTKVELDKIKKLEASAKAELAAAKVKVQKAGNEYIEDFMRLHNLMMGGFESAFRAVSKSELDAPQPDTRNNDNMSTKVELDEIKKSEASAKTKLAAAKVKVQNTGNEYFEDFMRLHNLMMDGFESAFGMVS